MGGLFAQPGFEVFGSCSCQAAGIWRDLTFGALFAAKPEHSQCWVCSLKGSCPCCFPGLIRELRELQILRKTKTGKTTELRMVTPCSPPSSTSSLPLVVSQLSSSAGCGQGLAELALPLSLSLSQQPGSVPAFQQPCCSPKLGRMGGDSTCRDSSVCLCCA